MVLNPESIGSSTWMRWMTALLRSAIRSWHLRWASAVGLCLAAAVPSALAQSGMRESLERLDRDGDGEIEPHEITPLARPYLKRVAEARRMSLDRDNDIEKWQEAARVYHATVNDAASRYVDPDLESSIQSFTLGDDEPLVPEFGLSEVRYPYIQDDLERAEQLLRRYDRNRDGSIDREEARRTRWANRNPFDDDLNLDGRLGRLELSQRYARRRLMDDSSDDEIREVQREQYEMRTSSGRRGRDDRSDWWRRGGTGYYLTASMMSRFDGNRNGRLDAAEMVALGVPVGRLDIDRDSEVSREELHAYLSELQQQAGDPALGIPTWFFERDVDRDDQVTMAEFAEDWSQTAIGEFSALDGNDDGILTMAEVANSAALTGGDFVNETAMILPPRKTVISEIVIEESFEIADLNVQLSITHSHVSKLDGYLVAPNGERVELFTEVGGAGNHFDKTIFDDQASVPITKASAPYEGRYLPEAVTKRKPGFSQFNGTNSQGVWKLVVAGSRNDLFGMLHRWALIIKPRDTVAPSYELSAATETDADALDMTEVDNAEPRLSDAGEVGTAIDGQADAALTDAEAIRARRAALIQEYRAKLSELLEAENRALDEAEATQ
ncbi:EF hand [Rubripirellula lacrimiformis]|uniref:EF hand n=1 Tax=Rubripirellula lacrimiformis TaxID=1930273 RepID=A0A517NBV1_9BACT|nr:proprotein convertase P-domain-containing protein [Rubripirellula lacrimiformis]QDT04613.1 EF hand [Rubripirellula lacrimiformis]